MKRLTMVDSAVFSKTRYGLITLTGKYMKIPSTTQAQDQSSTQYLLNPHFSFDDIVLFTIHVYV